MTRKRFVNFEIVNIFCRHCFALHLHRDPPIKIYPPYQQQSILPCSATNKIWCNSRIETTIRTMTTMLSIFLKIKTTSSNTSCATSDSLGKNQKAKRTMIQNTTTTTSSFTLTRAVWWRSKTETPANGGQNSNEASPWDSMHLWKRM